MREYLLTLCITAAVTYLLTEPVRKFAIVARAMPEIRARDVHKQPTPRLGGIAMFFGLCAGLLAADHLANLSDVFVKSNEPRALLSGAALIWLIGVLDDKFEIDALIKLGGQMIAAGVMVMQGLTILWLPVPGVGTVALTQWQGTLLTVALVVITINAVNFVDGLDGLAAGMVCIAAAAFFMYAYRIWYSYGIEAAAPATLFAAVLMGMCLGFLPHNMHPARIFMGDSGSMLIGLVLAAGAISVTGQVDPDLMNLFTGSERNSVHQMVPVYIPLLMPLTIIAIPTADFVFAVVRRTWRGQSPFAADRGHLHHRLLQIGHSHSRAVLIMYFWAALIGFGALAYSVNNASMWIVLGIVVLSFIGLVLLLLPRFQPRAPRWAERFVPPRYRRRRPRAAGQDTALAAPAAGEAEAAQAGEAAGTGESSAPLATTAAAVNGASALGARPRLLDGRKTETSR
ncbi:MULTISPECIES: MraY family glycosyltransferase [Streptomyces]|uniref:Undecaprenyl/decaprenyl-phosphate alpha-N-acetylglucosaminyl 1-phosphate transferase n=1 Tax=Streptomyces thermoviolaceus subsp. thermoviolaceus TaxID=66860 RepID=A0ABX0YXW1_STRTL|nr:MULTISPECIES: MraY family glycosyltransferase [Streptomyces]MCM3263113.1 undecaprenyl/decaprenyl-phosphate alpha-N-acetylglucosaminyl 1-phosphate transferase [Streptomyces thermoviolaceus]NJP17139.1 undecaprenyl/decaprenyl-phosphate alpha-N-acetylglucosaminyl 1-phosphate transferase [Streptomyces thermoviolaceus subsp. thermoviolaceus]RSS07062.1 undecaprenyl/decaprenyl-phosphate alpha-N-acetylglucosaminyl 1-phosphate transferase [Streptomyces sp. WAC00469]WTD47414.1 undecaprenyl/decaprenyl-p